MYNNNCNGRHAAPARGFMALWTMLLAYGVLGAVATVTSTPVHAQSFSGICCLSNQDSSRAQAVNADGTVVVGFGYSSFSPFGGGFPPNAFRWTQAGGMVPLPFSNALGVNADGTVVVGFVMPVGGTPTAVRWTQFGGVASLGFLTGGTFSQAQAVNADGTVVVGYGDATGTGTNSEAFRWT
jgi:uncharacterized membrane protein